MFNDHTYTNHTQIQCFNILFILKEGRDVISYVHTAHPYLSNVYVSPGTVESTRHAVSQIINCSTICGFKSTFILNHYCSFEYYTHGNKRLTKKQIKKKSVQSFCMKCPSSFSLSQVPSCFCVSSDIFFEEIVSFGNPYKKERVTACGY